MGGWHRLARSYRWTHAVDGTSWWFQSADLGTSAEYGNCLIVTANEDGLRIAMPRFLRLWHPALFLPWGDMTAILERNELGLQGVKLTFAREPSVSLRLDGGLVTRIQTALGHCPFGALVKEH